MLISLEGPVCSRAKLRVVLSRERNSQNVEVFLKGNGETKNIVIRNFFQ